ncbi:cytosine permease [Psychrobacillus sp. FSL K6-2836]|uniref:purine-cytosine permease family protein n=1 Tax=Psychrobacillus sp. FSL K6-2836 TaxID=2921548 RepID=UPI0030F4C708
MTNKEKKAKAVSTDEALFPVPLNQRQHWIVPAVIFGGLEFSIPVLLTGALLATYFGITEIFWILFVSLFVVQWIGNAITGYMGAITGISSSVIARSSFGHIQARWIIGFITFFVGLGWWALQTAVTGEAIAAMFGIDYENEWGMLALITTVCGLIFAVPSIFGMSSMKWTDIIAVPAGLLLVVTGIYLVMKDSGWEKVASWQPESSITILAAISLVLGMNVSQWVGVQDYTRYAKPKVKDNLLIPIGIIGVGFPLFFVGAIMAIGVGEADIVQIMLGLGFPMWGFLILWLSTWTSQIVNSYSMGLSMANMMNINSGKGRAILTFIGTILGVGMALGGVLNYFEDFLYVSGIIYGPIAGIMIADFFFIRSQTYKDNPGWNWMATIAMAIGIAVAYYTQYIIEMGIPAVQSLFISAIVYLLLMKVKHKIRPDQFTKVE